MRGETKIVKWGPPDNREPLFRITIGLIIVSLIIGAIWFISSVGGKEWLEYLMLLSGSGLIACSIIERYLKRKNAGKKAVLRWNLLTVSLMVSMLFSLLWIGYGERALFIVIICLFPLLLIIVAMFYLSRKSISFVLKVPKGFSVRLHEELLRSTSRYLDGMAMEYSCSGSSFSLGARSKVHIQIGEWMIDEDRRHNIILRSRKPEERDEWEMAILHIISSIDNLESYPTDEEFLCPACRRPLAFIPASNDFFCHKCGKSFKYEEVVHDSEKFGA